MSIIKYETLLKVVETKNITKAAEQLGYTQSAVSQMLNSLEKELGLVLLNRNKNGITLTSPGEKLLPHFRETVNANRQINELASDINGHKAGFIRIGSVTSISVTYLPEKIRMFNERYPDIEFEILQGDYTEIENWIKDGTVDCGFIVAPAQVPIDTINLFRDPFYVITSIDHPLKNKNTVSMDDLRNEVFVSTDLTDYDLVNLFKNAGFTPRVKYTTQNDYATIAMVEQGLGIAIMPNLVLKKIKKNICLKRLDVISFRTICIAVRSLKHMSPLTSTFVDLLKESISGPY